MESVTVSGHTPHCTHCSYHYYLSGVIWTEYQQQCTLSLTGILIVEPLHTQMPGDSSGGIFC